MRHKTRWTKVGLFCLLVLFFLTDSLLVSKEKRPLAPEDMLHLQRVSDPQISPDGDRVAFVVSQFGDDKKMDSNIWIVSRDGNVVKQLTKNPGADTSPRWSPDGEVLAFLSRRDSDRNAQIYFYSLKAIELEKTTDEKSSIRNFKWSPDGQKIAFLMTKSRTEEEIERQKKGDDAFVVDEDFRQTHLWIMDVENLKTRLLTEQDMTIWRFRWSPDSQKIAVLASLMPTAEGMEYQSHLSLIDVAGGNENILVMKTNAQATPSFSPDGKWIVFMGPVGQFKERGIPKIISAEGGEPIDLLEDYKGNVWDVVWHPKKEEVIAAVAAGTRHHLALVDRQEKVELLFEMNHSTIPYWASTWTVSSDGEQVAFLNETPTSPPEVWVSRTDGTGKKQLTFFNDDLNKIKLGKVEEIEWTNPEDEALVTGIVIKPAGFTPEKRSPLVVWLHGGPAYNWSLGSHISNWAQLFAAQGYMVLLPNFRGSSGKGMEWMMANVRNWGEGPMSDVMRGVDYLVQKGWVDEERMFVGGGSYGGYLTFWIITQTDRFKAAFARAGVADLATEYALTDEPTFSLGYFVKSPYEDPEIYRKNSPITYASQVKTPVLIVHGERDLRVPVSQAYQFYSALKHYGARAKLVVYPREPHGIREYTHRIDVMSRAIKWFKK